MDFRERISLGGRQGRGKSGQLKKRAEDSLIPLLETYTKGGGGRDLCATEDQEGVFRG